MTRTLSHDELVYGYWPARKMRDDTPQPIRHPDQYDGSGVLDIACTQTELRRSQQEKLVDEWCKLLPTLHLKTLVFSSKVTHRMFEAACMVHGLEALSIKWSSIATLAPIVKLTSLSALFLGGAPQIADLAPLSTLVGLRHLFVQNVRAPVDLSFVRKLRDLREFGVSAARGRRLLVQSLDPLGSLERLELLWLVSLKVKEGGLRPLYSLQHLCSLRTTIPHSSRAFADLCAALPNLQHFHPVA